MAARSQGARVLVTSDTRCFSAASLLLCPGLSSASKFRKLGFPNLGAQKKKKRRKCSKAPIYFCFDDFYVLSFKNSKVLKKKPAARRADFFLGASEQKSLVRAMIFGETREKSRSGFGNFFCVFSFFLYSRSPLAPRDRVPWISRDIHG